MHTPAQYRVEHRQPCRSTTLAVLTTAKPNNRALDPFLSRLLHDGKTGWVVLVDEATGAVAARRRIKPPRRPVRSGVVLVGRQAAADSERGWRWRVAKLRRARKEPSEMCRRITDSGADDLVGGGAGGGQRHDRRCPS